MPAARARKPRPAELKTKVSAASVPAFLAGIADPAQRADAKALAALFGSVTKQKPKMWGTSMVGYGSYAYVGKSGRAGEWFVSGFSPRKGTLTLYMLGGWAEHGELLAKLGKHSLGVGCLYLKRLSDADPKVLKQLLVAAQRRAKALAPKMAQGGVA